MNTLKIDHKLSPQSRNQIARTVGVNLNYWYPMGWADELKVGQVKEQVIWETSIAIFRGSDTKLRAIKNRCLHRGIELHKGAVDGNTLVCPYHGWKFSGTGSCVEIPYLDNPSKIPKRCLPNYPIQERYNIIWVFPGDSVLAEFTEIPSVPEYDDPEWLILQIPAKFNVHFSMVNENPLDIFHGHLHRDLQNWYNPTLISLEKSDDAVEAAYEVTFRNNWLSRFIGIAENGIREVKRVIQVAYFYPHCRNTMQGKSNYYFMRQPEGPSKTSSYSLLCLKVKLPKWLVHCIRKPLSKLLARFLIKPYLDQDIEVMESEQHNFDNQPDMEQVEINPVIVAAQNLTINKFTEYQSKIALNKGQENTKRPSSQ